MIRATLFSRFSFSPFLKPANWSMAFLLSLGMMLNLASNLRAEDPNTAPPQLKALIGQMDAAGNQKNFEQIKTFYSPKFTNSDGLSYADLEQSLKSLWKRYPDLKYTTELISWEKQGDNLVAQTETKIEGTGKLQANSAKLNGTIQSRQVFQGDKLVSQEILNEKITLTSGTKPPNIEVKLPESVRPGQEFDFDVILKDPIGNNLFAGAAMNQAVDTDNYLNPSPLDLELLQAGGLFKRSKAPTKPENRWLSGVLIGADGITWVIQRLRVEK